LIVQSRSDDNILESKEFLSANGRLVVPFGTTEDGEVLVRDLSVVPHMLVCGISESGKTVFVSTLISVIISRKKPEDVRFVIFDTKIVEYNQFNGIPHLLCPVVSERDKLFSLLNYISNEIRARFKLFKDSGCKDYKKFKSLRDEEGTKLPELFVVIDDFAGLKLDKNDLNEFMDLLINGRTAGVHVIVVSSMSLNKTIHKELMSEIPCKICFKTSTSADSKAILEKAGAECLLMPGEMIYKYQNDCIKLQSAYAIDENIEEVMNGIKSDSVNMTLLKNIESGMLSDITDSKQSDESSNIFDEYIEDVALLVIDSQKASIGQIQRIFRIGFNRAARIIDQLEELGVVGPENGTFTRKVLMTPDDVHKIFEVGNRTKNATNYEWKTSPVPIKNKLEEAKITPINLRDFAEFSLGKSKLSVHDNEIHYARPIKTVQGEGIMTASFDAGKVIGLVYKKPSLLLSGYFTFEFAPNVKITNISSNLLFVQNNNDISDILKMEFGIGKDRVVKQFLSQLSEDIGVEIKHIEDKTEFVFFRGSPF